MLRSYLTVSLRYFRKNQLFMLINLVGLAVGMAAFIVIIHYVNFEKSYDRFHENGDNIFRVTNNDVDEEGKITGSFATTGPAYGPLLKNYFPEVVAYTRLVHTRPFMSKPVLSYQGNNFFEDHIYYADQSFMEMFSYRLVSGDLQAVLQAPRSIIISQSSAQKYFGMENPIGKVVNLQMGARGDVDLKVTGIMQDFPANSHLQADMLISFNTLPANWNLDEVIDWGDFYVYIQLHEKATVDRVSANLPGFLTTTLGEYARYQQIVLQNIKDIHLESNLLFEAKPTGDGGLVNLLLTVAIIILIIAWINYINLTTVKSLEYVKEAGLRKMFGAKKTQLYWQQMINALIINFLAFLMAFSVVQLILPYVSRASPLSMNFSLLGSGLMLTTVIVVVGAGSLLSGLYPAMLLSRQNLNQFIKGNFSKSLKGKLTRKSLVVFQFVVSIVLIALTLTVYRQMQHIQNKDLGMSIDRTLIIKGPGRKDSTYFDRWKFFASAVSGFSQVDGVAASTNIPGRELAWGRRLRPLEKPEDREVPVKIIATGPEFFDLYEMQFVAGSNFSRDHLNAREVAILNEEAIKLLGYESPEKAIEKTVVWEENNEQLKFKIIGVVRNFNQQSPKQPHVPIIFPLKTSLNAPWAGEYFSVKLYGNGYAAALKNIESAWQEAFAGNPFDYFFLDAFFDRQYKADRQFGQIFGMFTILAVLIANLGLLGLFGYSAIQKTKEIGIRKVLGATEFNIIKLLSYEYVWLSVISLLIAAPIAYFAATEWLQHFAYRISLGWWFFVLPVLAMFLMLGITLTSHLIKTAKTNPVESLRYE